MPATRPLRLPPDMRQRLLVIGNGMASVRLVETLVRIAPERFAITVAGAEAQPGYNRVLLSALLAQDVSAEDVILRDRSWYESHGIRLVSGNPVCAISAGDKSATLKSREVISFDQCVFATGSHPIRLPIQGMDKPGVITFRDLSDVAAMEEAALAKRRVAVIGGGLLGVEAAYGLARRGAEVILVHVMDRLMERQLDAPAAALVAKALERKGVTVLLSKQTLAVAGETHATGLAFADGTSLDADMIVCAVGIRPNADLAKAAGLAINRGIVVDHGMSASLDGYHAIGECAEHNGTAYGLVEPAHAQAEALAARLVGADAAFTGMVLATNLKVSGLPVFSAGTFLGGNGLNSATLQVRKTGTYRKLVFDGARLVGCVLVGETDDALWYLDLIRSGADLSAVRRLLIHGRDFTTAASSKPDVLEAA
jgi:nitrite reductase (NADH) large subunit